MIMLLSRSAPHQFFEPFKIADGFCLGGVTFSSSASPAAGNDCKVRQVAAFGSVMVDGGVTVEHASGVVGAGVHRLGESQLGIRCSHVSMVPRLVVA